MSKRCNLCHKEYHDNVVRCRLLHCPICGHTSVFMPKWKPLKSKTFMAMMISFVVLSLLMLASPNGESVVLGATFIMYIPITFLYIGVRHLVKRHSCSNCSATRVKPLKNIPVMNPEDDKTILKPKQYQISPRDIIYILGSLASILSMLFYFGT